MKPLSQLSLNNNPKFNSTRNSNLCKGLLFDIDDTLTTRGQLSADSYHALSRLQAAGVPCIAVTGRPAGWCDLIARLWPVAAVVGENGAFYMHTDQGKLRTVWASQAQHDAAQLSAHRERLMAIAAHILAQVPGCALASDQAYRVCDLAIDFCEDVPALPLSAAQHIAALMQAQGMTAKISSIHVNGWFGAHDKRSATLQLLSALYGQTPAQAQSSWVYVGDSPNDASMFAAFEHSVGVANVLAFGDLMPSKPQFVTPSESGAGFVELAEHWLKHLPMR